ncbi:hypothetical protein G7067_13355 [Leucobacter insecticola]|uniref:Uncharacterized protein n=1 Tax=Leucobacter insecticola TaxID=2714934 RepID=A0A6G8FLW4_9MICO|nr:hypothetical protein G7067_13355 [Leucobacter insecticola]
MFGPAPEQSDEPAPVSARDRLAYEQAERVRTSQLATKPQPSDRIDKAKPWIVVGMVAVLALVGAILVLNLARGDDTTAKPTADPAPQTNTSSKPTTTSKPETSKPVETTPAIPQVEVGATNPLPIVPWGVTSELSQKFGSTSFNIPDGANLVLTSSLLDSFPDSCAAMRQEWGATRLEDGTFKVRKPAGSCKAAPELFDEIWGLTDAWVKTIRPAA